MSFFLDEVIADHTTPGTVGAFLNDVLAGVYDPNAGLPGSYAPGTIGALIGKLNVGGPEDPVVPIVAVPGPDQAIGFLITRDASGDAISGVPIWFQLTAAAAPSGESYRTAPFKVVSIDQVDGDDTFAGVLQHAFLRGATYRARRTFTEPPLNDAAAADKWVSFTVPDAADPFALPLILGSA